MARRWTKTAGKRALCRVWSAAALLAYVVSGGGSAAERFTSSVADPQDTPIEEILVTAVDRCGPWPIAHRGVAECFYPEWKREELGALKALRERYLDLCVTCSDADCRLNRLRSADQQDRFYCKRLFQTPKEVPRLQTRALHGGHLVVEFGYDISSYGRVRNVRILSLDGDLSEEFILELITESARSARFEPIEIEGRRMPLIDVVDTYVLED